MIDPIAKAALDKHKDPVYMAFIDFVNEPQRVNTSGRNLTFTGTGFPEVDGFEFDGLRSNVLNIGEIQNTATGSQSLKITLSGLTGLDDDMLEEIYDRANYQGRIIKIWRIIYDTTGTKQGGLQAPYTGRITSISLPTSPTSMTIEVTVEGYLASLSPASNRTYKDQEYYDAGDFSGRTVIGAANNGGGGNFNIIPTRNGLFGNTLQ
jgi:hypothetical protein